MAAEYIEVKDLNADSEKLKKCAECIDAGGLVVFSTETVYGIACRAEKKSLERLDTLKQRNPEKRYTLHIGSKDKLTDYVLKLSLPAKKLVKNAWPGPLTIIFELTDNEIKELKEKHSAETVEILYKNNTIGIRCPDEPFACTLLNLCKYPVVAPSANLGGQPPATDGKTAYEQIGDFVDIIINSGTCKYEKSSTVAQISPSGLKILRVGAYSERQIQKMYNVSILFACTGNTCRSPMAEGLAKKKISEKIGCDIDLLEEKGYKIESAGILAVKGFAASDGSVRFCASKGVDISNHISQRLTVEKIKNADYIFAMSNGHKDAIIQLCPQAEQKCLLLKDGQEIDDPIGGDLDAYSACGQMIEQAVDDRIDELFQ
ncbi:MAG: L-threonylcarbamoyladenylate synthase [Phycisphaerales bacterium]